MSGTLYDYNDEDNAYLAIYGFDNGDVFLSTMIGTEHRIDVSIPADEVRVLQLALMRHVASARTAPPLSLVDGGQDTRPVKPHTQAGRRVSDFWSKWVG